MKHPLHPALVHFPVACWSLATASDLLGLFWGAPAWRFAGVVLAIGTITAIVAMLAGFVELLKVEAGSPAIRIANLHMLLAASAWSCYAASLLLRLEGVTARQPGALEIGLSTAGFAALCVTGWLGGKLVYGHGIGVRGAVTRDAGPH